METLAALAEPNRQRILDLLLERERGVNELVGELHVSQPAVSKHLKVLRGAGLVEARVDAQRRIYRVVPEPLQTIDEWLTPYRRLWSTHLDDLERHLDEMDDPPTTGDAGGRASAAPLPPAEPGAPTTRTTTRRPRR
jgi:DNA-binding transcriptional ArsR family regulator